MEKTLITSNIRKHFFLLVLCLGGIFTPLSSWSQHAREVEKGVIQGLVLESGSSKRLARVNVLNKTRNLKVISDLRGEFSIAVSLGDTLIFSALGYADHSTVIHTFSDILIDLKVNSILLETVSINSKNKEAELQDVVDSYTRHGVYQGGKPSVVSYIFTPITALYERFSKKGKQARHFRSFMEDELAASQIDRLFSRYRVVKLTNLEGDDLTNFMLLYRPTYEQAVFWGEYDVTKYINDSFQKFVFDGKPEAFRLPRINSETKF